MKSTFTILFYLRKNRVNKNGESPIISRITINREKVQFSTKLQTHPTLWEQKTGRCVGRSSKVAKIDRLLDGIRVKNTDLYHKHLHEYGYALPEKIKNIILGIETEKKKMLLEYFDEHNEFYLLKIGHDTSQITYGRYQLTQNRLKEYLKAEYNLLDIPVIEVTPVSIEKFFLYLQNEHRYSNNNSP